MANYRICEILARDQKLNEILKFDHDFKSVFPLT